LEVAQSIYKDLWQLSFVAIVKLLPFLISLSFQIQQVDITSRLIQTSTSSKEDKSFVNCYSTAKSRWIWQNNIGLLNESISFRLQFVDIVQIYSPIDFIHSSKEIPSAIRHQDWSEAKFASRQTRRI